MCACKSREFLGMKVAMRPPVSEVWETRRSSEGKQTDRKFQSLYRISDATVLYWFVLGLQLQIQQKKVLMHLLHMASELCLTKYLFMDQTTSSWWRSRSQGTLKASQTRSNTPWSCRTAKNKKKIKVIFLLVVVQYLQNLTNFFGLMSSSASPEATWRAAEVAHLRGHDSHHAGGPHRPTYRSTSSYDSCVTPALSFLHNFLKS